jgi:hypothetical protein
MPACARASRHRRVPKPWRTCRFRTRMANAPLNAAPLPIRADTVTEPDLATARETLTAPAMDADGLPIAFSLQVATMGDKDARRCAARRAGRCRIQGLRQACSPQRSCALSCAGRSQVQPRRPAACQDRGGRDLARGVHDNQVPAMNVAGHSWRIQCLRLGGHRDPQSVGAPEPVARLCPRGLFPRRLGTGLRCRQPGRGNRRGGHRRPDRQPHRALHRRLGAAVCRWYWSAARSRRSC